jgi:hypothetical protein
MLPIETEEPGAPSARPYRETLIVHRYARCAGNDCRPLKSNTCEGSTVLRVPGIFPGTRGALFGRRGASESSHYEARQLGGTDGDRALPLVGNEAQFSETIHKEADSGSGCANHFCQLFLMDGRNHGLRFASVVEVRLAT